MSGYGVFWFVAGAMSALAACLVALPLVSAGPTVTAVRGGRVALVGGCVVALATAALLIYLRIGNPGLAGTGNALPARHSAANASAAPPQPGAPPQGPAGSLDVAAAGLAQRLAAGGGTDADWNLLARSYEFMGRASEASLARQHRLTAAGEVPAAGEAGGSATDRSTGAIARFQARLNRNPRDAQAWLGLAEAHRQARDFIAAAAAFERAEALGAMTADAWADEADVLAVNAGNRLAGAPATAIHKALKLDPRHPKALWLDASLALEQRDYPAALARWRRLRAVLPPESPDTRVVDANIAEADRLANGPLAVASVPSAAGAVRVAGTVELDPALSARVRAGMTLYIYAKSPDAPGPPLAVLRTVVDRWPVAFTLDDSMAMLPARKLSGFDAVVVEARISPSGNAVAASGDLIATSPVVRPRDGLPVALTISREIG